MPSVREAYRASNPLEIARDQLSTSEELIWADQPGSRHMAQAHDWKMACVGLAFTAFVSLFLIEALNGQGGASARLTWFIGAVVMLLPLLGGGLWLLFSPLRARWRAEKTVYAITSERLLIITRSHKVLSFVPEGITTLEREEHDDGTSSIVFYREPETEQQRNSYVKSFPKTYGFFGIRDGKQVEAEITQLLRRGTFVSPWDRVG